MGISLKLLLLAAVLCMLIFAGCASNRYRSPAANNSSELNETGRVPFPSKTIVDRALPNTTKETPKPEYRGKPDRGCEIDLNPSQIYAGDSVELNFKMYTKVEAEFTYNCGSDVLRISTGGALSGLKMCKFTEPGSITVWMKDGNVTCAEKTLLVKPFITDPRTCYIDNILYLPNYTYNATVHFHGFSEGDDFVWFCDSTAKRKPIKRDPATMELPGQLAISCEFSGEPQKDQIEVDIGPVNCGSIPTRQ